MPQKYKIAPKDYYDMPQSVEKSKKVTQKQVFGKDVVKTNKTKKKTTKKKSTY
jgi:hypothetical protein